MGAFYLLDHSLKNVGGHHYDYAFHVLSAAEKIGWQPKLACHLRFRQHDSLPENWDVMPVFPRTTYSRHAIYSGGGAGGKLGSIETTPRSPGNPLQWVRKKYNQFDRARQIKQFANACRQFFAANPLKAGDQVFAPTLSEFDLQGLVEFLATDRETLKADWHLQFHFNVFDGREPDFASQNERLKVLRTTFRETLARASRHRLFFYNTSEPLSEQYGRLEIGEFQSLAYPVNPAFHGARPRRDESKPIRITCAGAIREEKGQRQLAEIVAQMWDEGFRDGRLQLVVQSNKSRFKIELPGKPDPGAEPIVYTKHPLSVEEYVEFIRDADIGLLMYDSDRYYVRRAGVLGEMLAAGVPVVVPGGCWLSDQVAGASRDHQHGLTRTLAVQEKLTASDCQWNQTVGEKDTLTLNGKHLETTFDMAPRTTNLVVTWETPTAELGQFAEVAVQSVSGETAVSSVMTQVVRCEQNATNVATFPIVDSPEKLRVSIKNAYHDDAIEAEQFTVRMLSAGSNSKPAPCGAVAMAFADRKEIPDMLRDMTANLSHYQATAAANAPRWFAQHDPLETVRQLVANSTSGQQSRAA